MALERSHVSINFNLQINSPIFSFHQFDSPTSASLQKVFAMAGTGLLGFLQVKYSGNRCSPFEAYPKTTFLALTSFLLYCFSYIVKLTYPSSYRLNLAARFCVTLFGPLFLSSVSGLLFPDSLLPVLISVSLSFSLSQLLPEFVIQSFWECFDKVANLVLNRFVGRSRVRNRGVQGNLLRNGTRVTHV